MVVALSIILVAVILNVTAKNAISELSKNLKISVYLVEDADQAQVNALRQQFITNKDVADVTYISVEDARQTFVERFQEEDDVLAGLAIAGNDSLPASLEVSVTDLSKIDEVEAIAKQEAFQPIVSDISTGKNDPKVTIDRAAAAQRYITTGSIIAASIFAVISMLIIFNTIRMAIFTRSDEIKIMKLLGATPGYIRGPFLVESSVYGVIAGTIAASLALGFIYALGNRVSTLAEFAQTYEFFTQPIVLAGMYGAAILLGILVGVISSLLAMEKHLKLKRW
jgi:cell division transport system permease protein